MEASPESIAPEFRKMIRSDKLLRGIPVEGLSPVDELAVVVGSDEHGFVEWAQFALIIHILCDRNESLLMKLRNTQRFIFGLQIRRSRNNGATIAERKKEAWQQKSHQPDPIEKLCAPGKPAKRYSPPWMPGRPRGFCCGPALTGQRNSLLGLCRSLYRLFFFLTHD